MTEIYENIHYVLGGCIFHHEEITEYTAGIAANMLRYPKLPEEFRPFFEAVANWNWEKFPKLTDMDIILLKFALEGDDDAGK